jgi:hypothetical protein
LDTIHVVTHLFFVQNNTRFGRLSIAEVSPETSALLFVDVGLFNMTALAEYLVSLDAHLLAAKQRMRLLTQQGDGGRTIKVIRPHKSDTIDAVASVAQW